jgi:hypothetical protein
MKSSKNWMAFVLELIGSLVLLWTVFGGVTTLLPSMAPVWSTANGGIWLPIFVGAAAIASVVLFFQSFANITSACECGCGCGCGHGKAKKAALVAGVTLVALTWGNMTWMWGAVLGFALVYLGAMSSAMSCTCATEMPAKAPRKR